MTIRVFGAVKGAGTQVREGQAARPIVEGDLGSTLVVGIMRRGPTDEAVKLTGGLTQYRRIYGGLTRDSYCPLAAEHFYEKSEGAGVLYALRVTDGSEVAARRKVYDRNVHRSVTLKVPPALIAAHVLTLIAQNGGRHGGREAVDAGDVTLSTAITGDNTADLGKTWLKDQWKGAVLKFPNDATGQQWKVSGNTTAGVVTIEGAFPATLASGTDGRWTLELVNEHEISGQIEALAVELGDSNEDPSLKWSAYVWRDGESVSEYLDVSMDSAGDAYWLTAITDDEANYEIAPTSSFTGDPNDALQRPANFAEVPAPGGVDGNDVTLQVVRWERSGTGNPYVDTVNDITWGSSPRPCTVVCTFTAATTYTVAVTLEDGTTISSLPGGTTGSAYASQHAWLPGWTIRAGATAASAGTIVTLYFRPLPANLADKGAYFYPFGGSPSQGDTRKRYRVVSNTHDTVTLPTSVTDGGGALAPAAPSHTGTVAGPFDLSAASLTFIYSIKRTGPAGVVTEGPFTLTESLSGAAETATALAADLVSQEATRAAAASSPSLITFEATADDKIKATLTCDFGGDAVLVVGAGTLNTPCGFTADDYEGTDGKIARLQFRDELGGGYDGIASIADSDYEAAWDLDESPINDLVAQNTGVLTVATPGVTTAAPVLAMKAWAYAKNALAIEELPVAYTTEADAIAWHEDNLVAGPSADYAAAYFPSWGKISNPYGRGLYTAPIVGAVLGLMAKFARDNKGYHLAPAGLDYVLTPTFKDLITGDTVLNNEALNGYGINEVRKRGAAIYLWGDRIVGQTSRSFLHKRKSVSHVGRTLLTNTDALVFSAINEATFKRATKTIRDLFAPWYRAGWFDDSSGPGFEDQVSIKVDASNNPPSERQAGNLNAGVAFAIVDTAERVIFTIGPNGVSENT